MYFDLLQIAYTLRLERCYFNESLLVNFDLHPSYCMLVLIINDSSKVSKRLPVRLTIPLLVLVLFLRRFHSTFFFFLFFNKQNSYTLRLERCYFNKIFLVNFDLHPLYCILLVKINDRSKFSKRVPVRLAIPLLVLVLLLRRFHCSFFLFLFFNEQNSQFLGFFRYYIYNTFTINYI